MGRLWLPRRLKVAALASLITTGNAQQLQELKVLQGHDDAVSSVAFSPGGALLSPAPTAPPKLIITPTVAQQP
jgi:hypothetical protein